LRVSFGLASAFSARFGADALAGNPRVPIKHNRRFGDAENRQKNRQKNRLAIAGPFCLPWCRAEKPYALQRMTAAWLRLEN